MENYGLKAHSSIVYCYSAYEDMSPDALDWSFVVFLVIYSSVLVFCTSYDVRLRKKQEDGQLVESLQNYRKLNIFLTQLYQLITNF